MKRYEYMYKRSQTQHDFDNIFYYFAEQDPAYGPRICRQEYVERINRCWYSIPDHMKRDLQRRKDHRSLGNFALHVYDTSIRERFLVNQWMDSLGRDDVKIEDHGIANDGRLIADTNGEGGKPDYRVVKGDDYWLLEVKFCPVQYKLTFKVCDLKNYARDDSLVLLIMGNTKMIGPNGDPNSTKPLVVPAGLKWSLFGRKQIRRMLKEIPDKPHKEVGGKPSIQLRDGQIGEYLKLREWEYDSAPASADVPLVD